MVCTIFGLFPLIFSEPTEYLNFAEGLSIVVIGWMLTCVVGMLPYFMWGGEFTLTNAWFESVSGYTTTGSTILNDIESLPKGLLLWRSLTHWIGGIGIILFVLLILPQSRHSRIVIYNTEISDISKMNFKLRARQIVQVLALVYVSLTFAETLILTLQGMSFFDALTHSFATIATGGFSPKNMSIAAFDDVGMEITIMVFMLISGIHFGLIFGTIIGRKQNILNSSIAKAFLSVVLIGVLITALKLYFSGYYGWWESLRRGAFQIISVGTTTGFATADTADWPVITRILIIYFTIQCAMVGSTSGGLKFDRVYMFFKSVAKQVKLLQHPHGVFATRMEKQSISERLEQQTMVFIIL
jgi:trk system potassium uptake protein TrkH